MTFKIQHDVFFFGRVTAIIKQWGLRKAAHEARAAVRSHEMNHQSCQGTYGLLVDFNHH